MYVCMHADRQEEYVCVCMYTNVTILRQHSNLTVNDMLPGGLI